LLESLESAKKNTRTKKKIGINPKTSDTFDALDEGRPLKYLNPATTAPAIETTYEI